MPYDDHVFALVCKLLHLLIYEGRIIIHCGCISWPAFASSQAHTGKMQAFNLVALGGHEFLDRIVEFWKGE